MFFPFILLCSFFNHKALRSGVREKKIRICSLIHETMNYYYHFKTCFFLSFIEKYECMWLSVAWPYVRFILSSSLSSVPPSKPSDDDEKTTTHIFNSFLKSFSMYAFLFSSSSSFFLLFIRPFYSLFIIILGCTTFIFSRLELLCVLREAQNKEIIRVFNWKFICARGTINLSMIENNRQIRRLIYSIIIMNRSKK